MKKVNAVRPKNENNFLRLLLSLKLAEYKIAAESFSEIVFFLVQYSFLFEDTEKVLNSCGTEQSQLYALQENRDLGARYLDPKYSRWLSTDPALGEYVPQAPINDEAKKHNQNLPGMGGIFNTINSNLYHYAGNNPIKYIDPDGRSEIYKRRMDSRHNNLLKVGNLLGFKHFLFRGRHYKSGYSIYQYSASGISKRETFHCDDYEIVYSDLDENIAEQAAVNVSNSKTTEFTSKKYKILSHDCQDYTNAIMKEYKRLWIEREEKRHKGEDGFDINKAWSEHEKKITARQGEHIKYNDINQEDLPLKQGGNN